ncbi:MAG: hypothetical protein CUN54_04715 [Phototrophicales bacterium]|nr:MAG: hypothetical protein CUN54_04715 [Phototrophicales bacterium]
MVEAAQFDLQLRQEFFALEQRWAQAIRQTQKDSPQRTQFFRQAYDEVQQFIDAHYTITPEQRAAKARHQFLLVQAAWQSSSFHRQMQTPRLFDIGCAQGDMLLWAAQSGWDIYGLDVASTLIAKARQKFAQLYLPEDHLFCGELAQSPFTDFDIIFHADVFEHLHPDSVEDFLRACYHRLKPGGIIVMITPHALSGPWDSTRFVLPTGTPPQGLHLKEYLLSELDVLYERVGFELMMLTGGKKGEQMAVSRWKFRRRLWIEFALKQIRHWQPIRVAQWTERYLAGPLVARKV